MTQFQTAAATVVAAFVAATIPSATPADGRAPPTVEAFDQDVSNGVVSAKAIVAGENGWMVVHRVKADGKPGPAVGHAPLRAGVNADVAALLTEPVARGDKLMLMIHSEAGGSKTGIFEYTLGAAEDGPIKANGQLVMKVIAVR